MALFLRYGVIAVALCMMLFCISCEKHPPGQMPEVQREQPDPAKLWSKPTTKNSDEPSPSDTPTETVSHEAR
jgi:hypothetical protein